MKAAAIGGAAAALLLAGCASNPAPAPAPRIGPPAPAPVEPTPPPAASAPPAPAGWEDQPLSPGDWRFVAGPPAAAEYGEGPASFALRCDPALRRILLTRAGAAAALTIRTTFSSREFGLAPEGGAALPASDPFLDAIVFSRGRFAVEAAGQPPLILPTWPEPARVIEECR